MYIYIYIGLKLHREIHERRRTIFGWVCGSPTTGWFPYNSKFSPFLFVFIPLFSHVDYAGFGGSIWKGLECLKCVLADRLFEKLVGYPFR